MPNQTPDIAAPATPPDPSQDRTGQTLPERCGFLLHATRILLRFGVHLRHTIHQRAGAPNFDALAVNFGTANLGVILAHLSRGLLRALALRHVLLARAARGRDVSFYERHARAPRSAAPDNPPGDTQTEQSAAAHADREAPRRSPRPHPGSDALTMPTMAEAIAQIRRRPYGRTITDICLDLGVVPGFCTGPVWNILFECMHYFGGSLDTMRRERSRRHRAFLKEWDSRPKTRPGPDFKWWNLSQQATRQVLGFLVGEDPINPFAPRLTADAATAATGPP